MDKIRLPKPRPDPVKLALTRKPVPRDELAKAINSMTELGEFVRAMRTGLAIHQAELATRASVGRHWISELEQGKPTLEAHKVLRVLLTLGFEIVLSPYDPPPPWMLRAVAAAETALKVKAAARRTRRNTRRARARELRLSDNSRSMQVDVE